MKVRLHKFQAGGSIIASTFQPITVTPGAYAPSLQQAEQSIAMATQSGAQSGESSKGSSDELTKKDLIESLKGIEGLPSDVNFVIDKISKDLSMAEILKNPITGESPINISDAYLKSIQYLNQVKNSKNTFDNAYKSATQNGSINEAAVTSSGLLVVKDSEGKMDTVSAQDYLKNQDKYILQTNGDLLQMRRMDPKLTFSDSVLDIVENGVSTKTITEFINQFSSGLGTDTLQQQGYSKIQSQRISNGINIIQEAQKNGINLTGGIDGLYKTAKLSEDQKRQASEAVTALYKMMPTNYKSLLAIKSGNAENPDKGVFDLITLMIDKNSSNKIQYQIDKEKEGKDSTEESSSDGVSSDKIKSSSVEQWFRGMGEQKQFNISLDGSQGFIVKGNTMGADDSGHPIGISTLQGLSSSSFGKALDINNATFGNGMRIDVNGSGKVIIDGNSITGVELPIDTSDPTPKPDFNLLKLKEQADNLLATKYNIQNPDDSTKLTKAQLHQINVVYRQEGLPQKYDENTGQLIQQRWKRFALVKGTTTQEAIMGDVDKKYIRKIEEDNEISNYQTARRKLTGDEKYQFSDSWFGGDDLYQGTIFIPVTDSYIRATAGQDSTRTVGQTNNINQLEQSTLQGINLGRPPMQIGNRQIVK